MAGEVEANCRLLKGQALLHTPGRDLHQIGLLRARSVVVIAHVEQAALVGVCNSSCGEIKGAVYGCHQAGAVELQRVEGTGLDQRFHAALVNAGALDAAGKVKQAGERPGLCSGSTTLARRDNCLNRLLPGALYGAQTVADLLVGDGLEAVEATVHIRWLKAQAHFFGVLEQHLELVGVVHFHRHIGAEELGRVVHLDPGRVVGQERVGGGVRLVEAVAGKLFHQVKNLVGLLLTDVVLGGADAEDGAVLGHFLGLLLAHGPAQHVGAAQRIAAQNLRGLHHLLLVDHDAVSLGEHLGHQRVRVLDHLATVLARHKAGDQIHGAGAVQGVQRNQVFQARGFGIAQHALHAGTFKLKNGLGRALLEQAIHLGIIQRQVLVGKVLLAGMALDDELTRNLQDGQRGQAQEVELHQADGLHVVLVVLAHGRLAAGLLVERAEVGQLARRNQHTPGVHADVARQAFELAGQLQERLDVFFLGLALGQYGLGLAGIDVFVVLLAIGGRQLQRDAGARLVGDQLADAIAKGVAHVQHPAHIAHHATRGHGAEGGDLADGFLAVFVLHIVDHQIPVGLAEVDVEVGHGDAFRIQKALKQQLVFDRVQVGNFERIGHQRTGARTPSRPHRAAVLLGPVDEVAHDQKVARKTHLQDGADLELKALHVLGHARLALFLLGVQVRHAVFEALVRGVAKIIVRRHAHAVHQRRRELRQLRLAQHQGQAAALGNLQRVGNGRGNVGKQRLHLFHRLEILLAGEAAHALGVAQDFAVGNADARLVRLKVIRLGELDRVRGDHRQLHAGGQLHGGHHLRLVLGAAGALQLQVKAMRKDAGHLQCHIVGTGGVALHQCLPDRPGLGAGECNQAFVQFFEPGQLDHGQLLATGGEHVLRVSAGNQLGNIQVALLVLHQQHHAGDGQRVAAQAFEHDFGTQDGFDALGARLFVKLQGPKQVGNVGDGQGRLLVPGGSFDHFINAAGGVNHGEFGVKAQVDKHPLIVSF